MINIEKAMKFLKDNDFLPNEFGNYIYSKDAHSANLAYILEEYAKQEREIAVTKALQVASEKIALSDSNGWNGLSYELGYQKAIEETNLLILSLAPQILKELNKD